MCASLVPAGHAQHSGIWGSAMDFGSQTRAQRRTRMVLTRFALLIMALTLLMGGEARAKSTQVEYPVRDGFEWHEAGEGLVARGISSLQMHPKATDELWAHVHGVGPCVSKNGGASWTLRAKGIREAFDGPCSIQISFDHGKPKIMYLVIDGHVYRSTDGGESWEDSSSGALASQRWDKKESRSMIHSVSVDPKKGVYLMAGTRPSARFYGGFYVSRDAGKSWEQVAGSNVEDSGLGSQTRFVRRDPRTEKNICIAGDQGLWYSDDRGKTFKRNDPGQGKGSSEPHRVYSLSRFANTRDLFAGTPSGVWHSKDAGKGWGKKPVAQGTVVAAELDPFARSRLIIVTLERGIEVSQDARYKQWKLIKGSYPPSNLGAPPSAAQDDASSTDDGEDKPADDSGDKKGNNKKDSDEKDRDKKGGDKKDDAGDGYVHAGIREILFHPRDRKTVYFASPTTGLHISRDSGETIRPVLPGTIGKDNANDRLMPSIAMPLTLVSTHPATGCRLAFDTVGGAYHRATGADTWSPRGTMTTMVTEIRPLRAAGEWLALGDALLKTADNGGTWSVLYEPESIGDRVVDVNIGTDGAMRILLERRGNVLTTTDGKEWTATKKEPFNGDTFARSLAVDPANSDHIVIAATTLKPMWMRRDRAGGVFETWDGGKSWQSIAEGLAPEKDDKGAARLAKHGWNRGVLARFDLASGLLLYGTADGRMYARKRLPPSTPKKELDAAWLDWAEVSPNVDGIGPGTYITASTYGTSADGSKSHCVVQIADDENGATQLREISGAGIAALWKRAKASATSDEDEESESETAAVWGTIPDVGTPLSSISIQVDNAAKITATDAKHAKSVLTYGVPPKKPDKEDGGDGDDKDGGEGDSEE